MSSRTGGEYAQGDSSATQLHDEKSQAPAEQALLKPLRQTFDSGDICLRAKKSR
jgi:hypothetical protein